MLPSKCLRTPANGEFLISTKGDIALGHYVVGGKQGLYQYFDELYKDAPLKFEGKLTDFTNRIRSALKRCGITLGLDDLTLSDEGKANLERTRASFCGLDNKPSIADMKSAIAVLGDNLRRSIPNSSSMIHLNKSGAAKADIMQLLGMRGFLLRPGGGETSCPILSNICDGLGPLEYFNSCHGSRYGLADKGLSTAAAGELTNILVQALQDMFIGEDDCRTTEGLYFDVNLEPKHRIVNRTLAEDIDNNSAGTIIDDAMAEEICAANQWVKLRSPVFCKSELGICKKCYGLDLATGNLPPTGYPIGLIAAQSIGEPGTQLTLRSFHTGGAGDSGVGIADAREVFAAKKVEYQPVSATTTTIPHTPNKMVWSTTNDPNEKFAVYKNGNSPAAQEIFKQYGKFAAAEYLLFSMQKIYSSSANIADHHFELVIRKMLSGKKIRGLIKIGGSDPGALARLAFRNFPTVLLNAAVHRDIDYLCGVKEKTISGRIIE